MEEEIQKSTEELIEFLIDQNENSLWPGENFLSQSVLNILWIFCTGKRLVRNDETILRLIDLLFQRSKIFDMAGGLLSQLPILRFIAPDYSGYNLINKLNQEFHDFFMEVINEHIERYDESKSNDDLIYAFLDEMKKREHDQSSSFHLKQLIVIMLDVFIAGSQATSTTIDLALMMLSLRPDFKQKCLNDIQSQDPDIFPCYADKHKFPYILAFILEVQRFFHFTPIGGPRRAMKSCELAGYHIPKNTTVLIGTHTVDMNEKYWKNPQEFCPERFLNEDESECIHSERLLVFGAGRRKCLGDKLAISCIFTFFINILKHFDIEPDHEYPASIKLQPGIMLSPRKYKIRFIKRRNGES